MALCLLTQSDQSNGRSCAALLRTLSSQTNEKRMTRQRVDIPSLPPSLHMYMYISHRAPDALPSLVRDALGYRDGADTSRLRADDLAPGADGGVVEQELRHLGGFPAPGFSGDEARLPTNKKEGRFPAGTIGKRGRQKMEGIAAAAAAASLSSLSAAATVCARSKAERRWGSVMTATQSHDTLFSGPKAAVHRGTEITQHSSRAPQKLGGLKGPGTLRT